MTRNSSQLCGVATSLGKSGAMERGFDTQSGPSGVRTMAISSDGPFSQGGEIDG